MNERCATAATVNFPDVLHVAMMFALDTVYKQGSVCDNVAVNAWLCEREGSPVTGVWLGQALSRHVLLGGAPASSFVDSTFTQGRLEST